MTLSRLTRTIDNFWNRYDYLLKRAVGEQCRSLLDVGCGADSPVKRLNIREMELVGVDLHLPSVETSRETGIHNRYIQSDALQIRELFGRRAFDCVIALDLIEHLNKEDGYRLIRAMEDVARNQIIIFTPNGYLPQSPEDDNLIQEHLSGWNPIELINLGFQVYGVNGWRPLRGERAMIRFKPHAIWVLISKCSQLFVENNPKYAFQLLCVKEL